MASVVKSPRLSSRSSSSTILSFWENDSRLIVDAVATSSDPNHPPTAMLDGKQNTFFTTTGLYPQEFLIKLKEETRIAEIKIVSRNIQKLQIDRIIPSPSIAGNKIEWREVASLTLNDTKGKIQVESQALNNLSVRFFRFTILSGYNAFCAVHSIRIQTSDGKWLC